MWICSFDKGYFHEFYLVRVTWSNVVNAKVWLVLVDNGLQMCLVSLLNLHIALAIW